MQNARSWFIKALGSWVLLSTSLITLANWQKPRTRAVLGMASGLVLLWVVIGGGFMYRFRDSIRARVMKVPLDWRMKFILFATGLALIEEAITTIMTNCAPLFGVKMGQAYITASGNYLDVVALHSVVVIAPMFVGWAVILWRYEFSPFAVFILFGLTGTVAEMIFGGPQHALEFAFWTFVYGLMIYLPAYCVPPDRGARPPRWWMYPLAVVVPFLFIPLVPLPLVASIFYPHHPRIHFPPIS
jgi:hypothetical protein